MNELLPNFCLLWICALWPGLWAIVAFQFGRRGPRGALAYFLGKVGIHVKA